MSLIAFRLDVKEADNGYIIEVDVYGDRVKEPSFFRIGQDLADTVHDAVGIVLGMRPNDETEQITGSPVEDFDWTAEELKRAGYVEATPERYGPQQATADELEAEDSELAGCLVREPDCPF